MLSGSGRRMLAEVEFDYLLERLNKRAEELELRGGVELTPLETDALELLREAVAELVIAFELIRRHERRSA